tara:strand:- start:3728 stop:3952 length:225 start_codon:yes stop_codon:yes gene_type:complete
MPKYSQELKTELKKLGIKYSDSHIKKLIHDWLYFQMSNEDLQSIGDYNKNRNLEFPNDPLQYKIFISNPQTLLL